MRGHKLLIQSEITPKQELLGELYSLSYPLENVKSHRYLLLGLSIYTFFIFCNTPLQGLRAGLITSYCHGTKYKKKKISDYRG